MATDPTDNPHTLPSSKPNMTPREVREAQRSTRPQTDADRVDRPREELPTVWMLLDHAEAMDAEVAALRVSKADALSDAADVLKERDETIAALRAELARWKTWRDEALDLYDVAQAEVERITTERDAMQPVVAMAREADGEGYMVDEVFPGWIAWGGRAVMDAYRVATSEQEASGHA